MQYIAAPVIYIIKITFDFGTRYVRYAQLPDGTWLTSRFVEAKEWKTRTGAERWLIEHPELRAIATVDFV